MDGKQERSTGKALIVCSRSCCVLALFIASSCFWIGKNRVNIAGKTVRTRYKLTTTTRSTDGSNL
jgi:hypothetical protein